MILQDNSEWQPTDEDLQGWNNAYGTRCNIQQELTKMESWLRCNPTKRKTKVGMRRFVNSWLSRASEKGGSPLLTKSEASEMKIDGFDPLVRDRIFDKLQEVMRFYNKEVHMGDLKIWCKALVGVKLPDIEEAFDQHILRGKYAPKPADILEIISEKKEFKRVDAPVFEPEKVRVAPKHISNAWMWYIGKFMAGGMLGGMFKEREVTPEQEEEYILTVNQECFRLNKPDAMLEEHRLQSIWG